MARTAALFLVLFAVYAATLGLDAFDASDYGGDEPHYLLAAESLIDDGDIDVKNQYTARAYDDFYPYELDKHGAETDGPAARAARRRLPAADRARARGRRRAGRRAVPGRARRARGDARLPARAAGRARPVGARRGGGGRPLARRSSPTAPRSTPSSTAGAALAGAALLALRLDERAAPRRGVRLLPAARLAAVARHEVRAGRARGRLLRRPRRSGARQAHARGDSVEVSLFASRSRRPQRGPLRRPDPLRRRRRRRDGHRRDLPVGYLDRAYRLVALWIDRDYGLLRWAPVFLLAFAGALAALPHAPRPPVEGGARRPRESS